MKRFKNILLLCQRDADHAAALQRAASLADVNSADLTILHVVPDDAGDDIRVACLQDLDTLSAPFRERLPIRTEIRQGKCFLETIRAVIDNGHDLVMKRAEDPDFLERLFGSTDMHLLRKCPCPLWLMKPTERTTYRSVIAAVDFNPLQPTTEDSALNLTILELAASQALADFADLHLVHSWQVFGEKVVRGRTDSHGKGITDYVEKEELLHRTGLRQLGEHLRAAIGKDTYDYLSPTLHVLKGAAHRVIPNVAGTLDADLIVMGTLARSGIAGLLIGNTAETILEQLRCSVLAVKPAGFVSPVAAAGPPPGSRHTTDAIDRARRQA